MDAEEREIRREELEIELTKLKNKKGTLDAGGHMSSTLDGNGDISSGRPSKKIKLNLQHGYGSSK